MMCAEPCSSEAGPWTCSIGVDISISVDALAASLERECREPKKPSIFDGVSVPKISLRDYLIRLRHFAFTDESLLLARIYIGRAQQRNENFVLSKLNVHRILMASAMIAAKFTSDHFYGNDFYASVGGVRTSEMNRLEASLLHLLKWRLNVSPEEFEQVARPIIEKTSALPYRDSASAGLHASRKVERRDHAFSSWVVVNRSPSEGSWSQDSTTVPSSATMVASYSETTPPRTPVSSASDDSGVVLYRTPTGSPHRGQLIEAGEMEVD
jgi:hypothetical protein